MIANSPYILGTAQLGMAYGIANTLGQPSLELAKDIVGTAHEKGITHFDTAQMYGTSEVTLGNCLRTLNAQSTAKIITKVAAESLKNKNSLKHAFQTSMKHLGVESLYCFMLHHEEYLAYANQWQGDFLQQLQAQGKIKHIGISVYSPEKALEALEHPLIHVVQIPSSLFDKRFIQAKVFEKAKKLRKKLHVRSVFLQGVLCMSPNSLPKHLTPLQAPLQKFHDICAYYSCSPSQAALAWMHAHEPEALLIFGAESITQIKENTNFTWQQKTFTQELFTALNEILVPQEAQLLNPTLWNK